MANNKRGTRPPKKKSAVDSEPAMQDTMNNESSQIPSVNAQHSGDSAASSNPILPPATDEHEETPTPTTSVHVPAATQNDNDVKLAEPVQLSDTIQTSQNEQMADAVQSKDVDLPNDTVPPTDSQPLKTDKRPVLVPAAVKARFGRSNLFNEDWKSLPDDAAKLRAAFEKISHLEEGVHLRDQAFEQGRRTWKKAQAEDAMKIEGLELHIAQLNEAVTSKDEEIAAMERKGESQRTEIGQLKMKLKDAENRSSQDAIEIHKATTGEVAQKTKVGQLIKEFQRLHEGSAVTSDDVDQLRMSSDATAEMANILMNEQFNAQEDAERHSEIFQEQKEEIKELKDRRHQMGRALSYELEQALIDDDDEKSGSCAEIATKTNDLAPPTSSIGCQTGDLTPEMNHFGCQTDDLAPETKHFDQTDRSTQCEESPKVAQAATQTSHFGKVHRLRSISYEHWFFIIAALLMLFFTIFAFYHGTQAKAERDMWLNANREYARRAVIYHRNASFRGQWVGWLTSDKMKGLGAGYGTKFGKYGVEM